MQEMTTPPYIHNAAASRARGSCDDEIFLLFYFRQWKTEHTLTGMHSHLSLSLYRMVWSVMFLNSCFSSLTDTLGETYLPVLTSAFSALLCLLRRSRTTYTTSLPPSISLQHTHLLESLADYKDVGQGVLASLGLGLLCPALLAVQIAQHKPSACPVISLQAHRHSNHICSAQNVVLSDRLMFATKYTAPVFQIAQSCDLHI